MDEQPFATGDVIIATVTRTLPFGVLVESADVPGLVSGTEAEPGTTLRVRVREFDAAKQRFSAVPA